MDQVRLGVIGCGGMARTHMKYFKTIPGLHFAAAADPSPDNLKLVQAEHPGVATHSDGHKLIASGQVDALLIATPHYFHPEYAIAGFRQGLHVLTEKPVAVTALAAEQVDAEHAKFPHLVYAAMFQLRNHPLWRRVKELVDTGQIGVVQRVNWIVTNWFRSQAYYDSATWRATWKGEGGGVLLNQCPHNLDLLCWLMGPPSQVYADLTLGRHHHIEVEDDVSAILRWKSGATGVFVTTTGEYPGTDRLELAGERGKLVVEDGKLTLTQTHDNMRELCATTDEAFPAPGKDVIRYEISAADPGHRAVVDNFVQAILKPGTPLICSGESASHELELGNALLMSGIEKRPIDLPMDRPAYDALLKRLATTSVFKKGEVRKAKVDLEKSFH